LQSLYGERDAGRGSDATFRWLTEEVGELARALREGERANLALEFGDVLASLANLAGIDLDHAIAPYEDGCPKCHRPPCNCPL
jgi:NTP pyrophosphatase (non-canonical NTP hydrolase)